MMDAKLMYGYMWLLYDYLMLEAIFSSVNQLNKDVLHHGSWFYPLKPPVIFGGVLQRIL